MIENVDVEAVASAAAGGGVAVMVSRLLISKGLRDIEVMAAKLHDLAMSSSSTDTKLSILDDLNKSIQTHDRKITRLETRLEIYDQGRDKKSSREVE